MYSASYKLIPYNNSINVCWAIVNLKNGCIRVTLFIESVIKVANNEVSDFQLFYLTTIGQIFHLLKTTIGAITVNSNPTSDKMCIRDRFYASSRPFA